ncbi:phosphatidate cytidylyltransferase [Martelella endophytica]|uniref:phosphatidate cytidylyltransferase n=1 Tax=Martelella endophytica TaxID=1486262 RepID=UPI0005F19C72|nr:phosphatidate cytidylyltransferase [Martelella endophytica]
MSRELRLRIVSGLILAIVVLAATWAGGLVFALLSILIGLLVFHEWTAMGRSHPTVGADTRLTFLTAAGWILLVVIAALVAAKLFLPALAICILALLVAFVGLRQPAIRWIAGGVFYAGASMVSLAAIRGGAEGGLYAMLFVFALVWATDIMAYFTGRAIGGPKLAPSISPGKTWSGAIGGAIFGVLAAIGVVFGFGGVPNVAFALLALLLSAVSQMGDLFESALKRRSGVKDSSHLIPGHGGVMDRVDGLVAAAFLLFVVVAVAGLADGGHNSEVGDTLRAWSGIFSAVDGD